MRTTVGQDVIVVADGGPIRTVRRGAPNFEALRAALIAGDVALARRHLDPGESVATWSAGRFRVVDGVLECDGVPVPKPLGRRVVELLKQQKPAGPLLRFWERLQKNPSYRSVHQLFEFLQHTGIPITPDGRFLAYKGVRADYLDCHSGAFDNSPGKSHAMPRNLISDDPDVACHVGFHVGALEYAKGFGPRVVVCRVDPEHVVSVPKDHSAQKMRVCAYEVVGNFGDKLPDDVMAECDVPTANQAEVEPAKAQGPKIPRAWRKHADMAPEELYALPLSELRDYAFQGLEIVGASKIPGGKLALIEVIWATLHAR